jgi:hypothetical protein
MMLADVWGLIWAVRGSLPSNLRGLIGKQGVQWDKWYVQGSLSTVYEVWDRPRTSLEAARSDEAGGRRRRR